MFGLTWEGLLGFLGTSTLISTILSLFIKNIIKSGISTEFNKKLANHKQDLNKELETHKQFLNRDIEQLKHEQNKIYKDFELFTVKKHELYPELFKLTELCVGKVYSLRGISRSLNFLNTDSEDINWFMTEKNFTTQDKKIIVGLWDAERDKAIQLVNHRISRINYNEAEEFYRNANDFNLLNALYFSEEVFDKAAALLKNVFELWINYDPDYSIGVGLDFEEKNDSLKTDINRQRAELKLLIKGEISSGLS